MDNAVFEVTKAAQAMVGAESALTQCTFGVDVTESGRLPTAMGTSHTEIGTYLTAIRAHMISIVVNARASGTAPLRS
ncbi:MAG: hypothetical protein ABJH04_12510 [Cyclobacteriaceae bacterium]